MNDWMKILYKIINLIYQLNIIMMKVNNNKYRNNNL